ncbi:class I SAM-dependent methyltransferase [Weeksellaceae bacterium TAE3-ERU29]|nr:class I SAM-dependent methyltransferase [Weeksellaceae bacterium TAE3-ERU29]
MSKHTEQELKEIAAQLKCPNGEKGLKVADNMFQTNTEMLVESLKYLDLQENQKILEIGHGNCKHLQSILSKAENLKYTGLDISDLMNQQAKENNKTEIENGQTEFIIYDGENIPFKENTFDKIVTVNTLYFFKAPINFFSQIAQILKPTGIFVLTFQEKSFLEKLAFTKYNFRLYDIDEALITLEKSGLNPMKEILKQGKVISKLGEEVLRSYYIIPCKLA